MALSRNLPAPPARAEPGTNQPPRWPVALVASGCLVANLILSLARWHRDETPSWDLAIFTQAVKGYAHLGAPVVDIKGAGFNQLGDHFSPILVLLAPFYRWFASPVTLLVAQCLLVAASVLVVGWCAQRHLGARPGLYLGLAYGLSWGLQTGVDAQFHEYAFAVPILALALAAYLDGKWLGAALWAGSLLLVKEDLGFTALMLGGVMAVEGHWRLRQAVPDAARQRRIGLVLAAVSTAATGLIFAVIMPVFNPNGRWDYWGQLGGEATAEGFWGRLTGLFTPAVKVNLLVLLAALVAGSLVLSRLAVLLLPTLAWRLISPVEFHWGTGFHYSMILMPIVFLAAVDALVRLQDSPSPKVRRYARWVPGLAAGFAVVSLAFFPLGSLVKPSTYTPSERAAQTKAVLALIPEGASVATDRGLIVHLVVDHQVFWLGKDHMAPDYVLIDPTAGWSEDPGDPASLAEGYYPGHRYQTVDLSNLAESYRLAQQVDPIG